MTAARTVRSAARRIIALLLPEGALGKRVIATCHLPANGWQSASSCFGSLAQQRHDRLPQHLLPTRAAQ